MSTLNLEELIIKAKKGNSEAFAKIYDLFSDRVYRFAYFRVGSREEAEDITAAIFLKLWKNLKTYQIQKGIPFEAWIFKMTRNKIIDFYRTRKQRISLENIPEIGETDGQFEELEINLSMEKVAAGIMKLPPTYQEIITLKYVEDLENEEIEKILNKPIPQIRVLQSRAIKALRKVLSQNG